MEAVYTQLREKRNELRRQVRELVKAGNFGNQYKELYKEEATIDIAMTHYRKNNTFPDGFIPENHL